MSFIVFCSNAGSVAPKRITKNPEVDTSFLPDRDREVNSLNVHI